MTVYSEILFLGFGSNLSKITIFNGSKVTDTLHERLLQLQGFILTIETKFFLFSTK